MSRRKSKNKNILIISITSFLLLVSILGAIVYKNQMEQPIGKESDVQKQEDLNSSGADKEVDGEGNLVEGNQSEQPDSEDSNNQNNNLNNNSSETNTSNEPPSTSEPDDSTSNSGSQNNQTTDSNNNSGYIDGQVPPTEPTYINGILVVNKKYPLPSTYNKGEDPVAKAALVNMLEAGKTAGFEYNAFSGFRSYEYQTTLYNRYVNRDGKENAERLILAKKTVKTYG